MPAKTPKKTSSRQPRRSLADQVADLKLEIEKAQLKTLKRALSNYAAADKGRRNRDWRASPGSADQMIIPDATTLNARARQAVRDTWIGASMRRAAVRNVAGSGIDVVPTAKDDDGGLLPELNKVARVAFHRWASDKKACDVEKRQNFWQKQRLAVSERYTVGEHFIVWSYAPPVDPMGRLDLRLPVGLRLQAFEPEQLDVTIQSYGGNEVRGGVEVDPATSEAVAYHFYTRNPNDYLSRTRLASERVPAERVLHYFDQERVLQTRGVTQFAPVLQEIRDFNRFKEATLWRAIMEACIGVLIKKQQPGYPGPMGLQPAAGDTGTSSSGMRTIDFVPGMAPELLPGEDVVPYTPSSPGNAYDPFTTTTLRGIGAGVGMSYDQVSRHSDSNYSAARQNMLEDWREWEIEQENLTSDVILPVYTLFFTFAAMEGRFDGVAGYEQAEMLANPCRFTDATCVPPARPWIDPQKEAGAYETLIKNRLITREEVVTARGGRFNDTLTKIADEKAEAESLDLAFPEDVLPPQNAPAAPPPPPDSAAEEAKKTQKDADQADLGRRIPLSQADAPGYALSDVDSVACVSCSQAVDGTCALYDFKFDPAFTCDSWVAGPVGDSPASHATVMPPPLVEGTPSIDNDAAGGFAPDARNA